MYDYDDGSFGGGWGPSAGGKFKGKSNGKGKDNGKDNGKGKAKGKGKGKGKRKPGHLLERTTLEGDILSGTVLEWKGKYGWIEPTDPVDHPKAEKHKGRIWVSKDDIGELEELTEGAEVTFQLWEDVSGIGAADVVQA